MDLDSYLDSMVVGGPGFGNYSLDTENVRLTSIRLSFPLNEG